MIRVAWLGHATVVIELDGTRVLTDPLLRRHNGPLRRRGPQPRPDQWRGADAVLISHLHHDHAELASLRMLAGRPVMSAPENAAWLRRRGLEGVDLADGWTPIRGGGVEVRLVRADHRHRTMPHRPNPANGHLLRGPSAAVWIAGDTSLHPEMAELADLAGRPVDLAVVPVGGWGPRLSPGHMDPAQAAEAVGLCGARWAVPVHWGTLHPPLMDKVAAGWLDEPGPAFAAALPLAAPACRAVVLAPGQETKLASGAESA